MVHNTGGGFIDNIPRILPNGCMAKIDCSSWNVPSIFNFLEKRGNIPRDEMYRTFNMGIGLLVIVDEENVNDIMHHFEALQEKPHLIGEITSHDEEGLDVELLY